jgi:hypothetical protein
MQAVNFKAGGPQRTFDDFTKRPGAQAPAPEPVDECPPCPQDDCKLHGTIFCRERCKVRREEG